MYEMGEQLERVILAGVQTYESDDTVQSLYELRELAETAGAVTVGTIMQSRETIHPATYLGKGKLEELKELLYDLDATGVICDDELSPAQLNNLEQELECKVMDRTMVILDIFAQRAKTSEGKIQVELAQLKYRAARLVGMRASLSRLGGGIGTRGPGEKKLEMDRRLIHSRIGQLKEQLEQVQKHRELIRSQRDKSRVKVAAIVGYTNAGKSTLLNIIGGIDNADSGYININGDKLEDMSEKKLTQYRRKHLGYVFQMYNLIGNLNVKENIEVGAYLSDNALDIDDLLHTLGLYEHRYKLPNQLSGGQQQRVSIGRAIVKNPDILLCDEPTGALDYNTSKEILKLIEEVNKKYGNTIIMVTHNEAIKNMADHVIKLRDGAVRHNVINTNKVSAEDLEW